MKIKKKSVFFSIVMICFVLISCNDDNGTGPNEESEFILPLAVGNQWQYVDSESDSVCLILEIISSQNVTYNGENVTIYNLPGLGGSDVYFFYEDQDLMITNETIDNVYPFLKYPVEEGDEWYNPFEGGLIKCLSTNQQIVTPADNFSCIVFGLYTEYNNNTPYTEVYCHPNIGFVAFHTDIDIEEEDKWSLLNTYDIN